jgi:hypothetical protein
VQPFKAPSGPWSHNRFQAPVAQMDRVQPSEGWGHRFESCRARQIAIRNQPHVAPPGRRSRLCSGTGCRVAACGPAAPGWTPGPRTESLVRLAGCASARCPDHVRRPSAAACLVPPSCVIVSPARGCWPPRGGAGEARGAPVGAQPPRPNRVAWSSLRGDHVQSARRLGLTVMAPAPPWTMKGAGTITVSLALALSQGERGARSACGATFAVRAPAGPVPMHQRFASSITPRSANPRARSPAALGGGRVTDRR